MMPTAIDDQPNSFGFRLVRSAAHHIAAFFFACAVILLAACAQPYKWHGTQLEPPMPAKDFALTAQDGRTIGLADFKGKPTLLFFGYTNCPDACPLTLRDWVEIRRALGADAARVNFVFISTDPARDTPARLKEFLATFDPSFIGLTGSAAALAEVYRAYGIAVLARQANESVSTAAQTSRDVNIDHTSSMLLLDSQGQLRLIFTDIPWQDITSDLRRLLE